MPKQPDRIRLSLSPEQRKVVRRATGRNAEVLELLVEELEERITPMDVTPAGLRKFDKNTSI